MHMAGKGRMHVSLVQCRYRTPGILPVPYALSMKSEIRHKWVQSGRDWNFWQDVRSAL